MTYSSTDPFHEVKTSKNRFLNPVPTLIQIHTYQTMVFYHFMYPELFCVFVLPSS